MSIERPVVAMGSMELVEAAQLAGPDAAVAPAEASAYVERVSRLIRDPQFRAQLGKSMRQRVEENYSFAQTARQLEQLCLQLTQSASTSQSRSIASAA
jgi:glycosyltransferase involved in cell wall biosynthesis